MTEHMICTGNGWITAKWRQGIRDDSTHAANMTFVKKVCAEYMITHLFDRKSVDKQTMEFVCWLLEDSISALVRYLVDSFGNDLAYLENVIEEVGDDFDGGAAEISKAISKKVSNKRKKKVINFIINLLKEKHGKLHLSNASNFQQNIDQVAEILALSDIEKNLSLFMLINKSYQQPEEFFFDHLKCNKFAGRHFLLNIIGISESNFNGIFSGNLFSIGYLEIDKYGLDLDDAYLNILQSGTVEILTDGFRRKKCLKTLPLEFHSVEKEKTDFVIRLLETKPFTSTHILLHGGPGTGKTSYAEGIIKRLGVPTFEIAPEGMINRGTRKAAILGAINTTNGGEGSLLLIDEADELLRTRPSWFSWQSLLKTQDKGYLNMLLEAPGVRAIWICNDINQIEASVLRRFSFNLHFKSFNKNQRETLWGNIARTNKVRRLLSHEDIKSFAASYAVSAGVIDLSVKKAKESGIKNRPEFKKVLTLSLEAYQDLTTPDVAFKKHKPKPCSGSIDGLNANADLQQIMNDLHFFNDHIPDPKTCEVLNRNLLFHGPSGSGKSWMAKHIAEKLDKELLCKRVSDILNPFVGGSEKNLKNSFEQAEKENAVLVFDEADSLLFSRERAIRSWESSLTNEFLCQMEGFSGILICTTNFLFHVDIASIRRFNYKVEFKYLSQEGVAKFYDQYFLPLVRNPMSEAEKWELEKLGNLAPGDFRVVHDRFAFRPKMRLQHADCIIALREESKTKRLMQGEKVIGF